MVDGLLILEGIKTVKSIYDQGKKAKNLKVLSQKLREKIAHIELFLNNTILDEKIRVKDNIQGLKESIKELVDILNDDCTQYMLALSCSDKKEGKKEKIKRFFNAGDYTKKNKILFKQLDSAMNSIVVALNIETIARQDEQPKRIQKERGIKAIAERLGIS